MSTLSKRPPPRRGLIYSDLDPQGPWDLRVRGVADWGRVRWDRGVGQVVTTFFCGGSRDGRQVSSGVDLDGSTGVVSEGLFTVIVSGGLFSSTGSASGDGVSGDVGGVGDSDVGVHFH